MSFLLGPLEAGLSAAFESKPDVPNFHWTDLVQQQLDTAQGNLDVLPRSEALGTDFNAFMRGERAKTLAGIPGLSDIEGATTANLKSWLAGELPADTQSAIQRAANAKAYGGGYGGSGMGANLTARDLGLTSLDLSQRAVPLANQYMGQEYAMRKTPEFDPSSMFLDPRFSAQFNAAQSGQQMQWDWLRNRVNAQPEPWQQSIMSSIQQGGAMGDQLLGAWGGNAAGGASRGGSFNINDLVF